MEESIQGLNTFAGNTRVPRVLLGVTGGIAAYKACEVLRGLQKAGVEVCVIMTESAQKFVGPITFEALSNHKVGLSLFDDLGDPIPHITAARWCDLFLVAPCTANVLAKLAVGLADDLLTSTALAITAPLVIAPAMNDYMYAHPATQMNLETLRRRGAVILEAGDGYLACGDVGYGRLADVEVIVSQVLSILDVSCDPLSSEDSAKDSSGDARGVLFHSDDESSLMSYADSVKLAGRKVLITAGPTREPIDAVRYISNYSSGKMGYAIAREAQRRGADVVLVSGPVSLEAPTGVRIVPIQTARDMLAAVEREFPTADIALFAAAVADYRPAFETDRKLKKGSDGEVLANLAMVENPDILATVAAGKRPNQVVIGFAAETDDLLENAQSKLCTKHADLIVANEVGGGKGFEVDCDKVWFVSEKGVSEEPLLSKDSVAALVLDRASSLLENRRKNKGVTGC